MKRLLISILFLILIFLPAADMWLKLDRFGPLYEHRELAKAPEVSFKVSEMKGFPKAYTNYFNDHFGFRNSLIRANFFLQYKLLGVSPSDKVVIGKEGWLFFTGEKSIEDFRGITRYDENTLHNWALSYEMKKKWLEQQGIKYLLLFAPNKENVYSEYLPNHLNKVRPQNGLEDLTNYIKSNTTVDIVDLRPALINAKAEQDIYYKTGTHWNNYGAFIAYQEVAKKISKWFPQVKPFTLSDFDVRKKRIISEEFADIIGGKEFLSDSQFTFKPKLRFAAYTSERILTGNKRRYNDTFVMAKKDSTLPRAVMFRDSFASAMVPFLSENFQYIAYYWQTWSEDTSIHLIVQKDKPDVIIEELVERNMKYHTLNFFNNPPKFVTQLHNK